MRFEGFIDHDVFLQKVNFFTWSDMIARPEENLFLQREDAFVETFTAVKIFNNSTPNSKTFLLEIKLN